MNAILVRIGRDQTAGHWNAPVEPSTGRFVYVPIPQEPPQTEFRDGCRRTLDEFIPALTRFCESCQRQCAGRPRPPCADWNPDEALHLDPDFEHLTYGDVGPKRGAGIAKLGSGDLLVFYAGLRPCDPRTYNLMYAIVGLYVIDEVVANIEDIPDKRRHENAHTRTISRRKGDIVVRARAGQSGKLQRCIPIGAWRERAYRVRNDLLKEWGGLSVKNGYIQRSAVPPHFLRPERFLAWFEKQAVNLVATNF